MRPRRRGTIWRWWTTNRTNRISSGKPIPRSRSKVASPTLPFTNSPLCLPDMVRKQLELKDVTFSPDLSAGVALPGADMHGLALTIALVNEEGEPITAHTIRFEPETLQLDIFAAYPSHAATHGGVQLCRGESGERHHITFVMGAWDSNGLQIC